MWEPLISAAALVAVAAIEALAARERKRNRTERDEVEARTESRAAQRAEESRLSMAMQAANCKLGIVTAKAVTHQHVNGDVEEAMTAASRAQKDYDKFLTNLGATLRCKP